MPLGTTILFGCFDPNVGWQCGLGVYPEHGVQVRGTASVAFQGIPGMAQELDIFHGPIWLASQLFPLNF